MKRRVVVKLRVHVVVPVEVCGGQVFIDPEEVARLIHQRIAARERAAQRRLGIRKPLTGAARRR